MITKPNNIIEFMRKINTDLKTKLNCKITNQYIKLEPDNEELHRTITKYLDDNSIPYYIIMPKVLRPVKIVIRGLPIDTNPDLIKTKLTDMQFQVANIYQLKKSDQDRTPMPLFQEALHNAIDARSLDIPASIGWSARCVKCAQEHLTSECPTQRTDAPLCANCNGKHPASYRGCPNFPKLNQTQAKTATTTINNTFQPKYTHSNLSFANVVSHNNANTSTINSTPNATLNSLQELAQDKELILILTNFTQNST
ncbi:nucleic-acid-binding protein from transposon X-element [Caerostris darwini]|uniref:Nucleic-acid-binding protein from transposon X-element n=1 Tax=Caerostris darwini TaxID=1538125 RepID=A0AAV4UND3_9ARAC|nr:nucleic-acid-binding protein from transposon X-element [Caerostris darwini]